MSDAEDAVQPAPEPTPQVEVAPPGVPPAEHYANAPAPAPAEEPQNSAVYRYVVKPVQAAYHIWEETTGERITTHPLQDLHAAEEAARLYNKNQSRPV